MSYIKWRKDNEDKYQQIADDGALETFPAFKESSTNDLSDTVIGNLVDMILEKPGMSIIHFICVFSEYLYEEYGVSPSDIELLTQFIIKASLLQTSKIAQDTARMVIDGLRSDNAEDGDPE